MPEESVEDFVTSKGEAEEILGSHTWDGEKLGPPSLGLRIAWLSVVADNDRPRFYACSFILTLLNLQRAYDAVIQSAPTLDENSAWGRAKMILLETLESRAKYRAAVLDFISEMKTQAKLQKCNDLAVEIIKRMDESEPEREPMSPAEEFERARGSTGKPKRKSQAKRSKRR